MGKTRKTGANLGGLVNCGKIIRKTYFCLTRLSIGLKNNIDRQPFVRTRNVFLCYT